MNAQEHFEAMVKEHLPDADLRRDPKYPAFYRCQSIQTAWAGFQAFHSEMVQLTTKSENRNHDNN